MSAAPRLQVNGPARTELEETAYVASNLAAMLDVLAEHDDAGNLLSRAAMGCANLAKAISARCDAILDLRLPETK